MNILGIDPGATTGWVLYDTEAKRVVEAGKFLDWLHSDECWSALQRSHRVIIESVIPAHGNIFPDTVATALYQGRLEERLSIPVDGRVTRLQVKRTLTEACHREPVVQDDKTVWQALCILHGDGCDAKPKTRKGVEVSPGGSIGCVTTHERAALALVVAWAIREGHWKL